MKIGHELQEILAMIHRNQAQIDLLTSNNTQLTSFLLKAGMVQNVQDLNITANGPTLLPARKKYTRKTTVLDQAVATANVEEPNRWKAAWTPERRAKYSKAMKKRFADKKRAEKAAQ